MIDVRVNNLTNHSVGYYRFPVVPRVGEGIIVVHGDNYGNRLEVVDVTYRQQLEPNPLEPEVFVVERPPVPGS